MLRRYGVYKQLQGEHWADDDDSRCGDGVGIKARETEERRECGARETLCRSDSISRADGRCGR